MAELRVRFSETATGAPLALVDFPGLGAELTPAKLRRLADALQLAADDCETGHTLRGGGYARKDAGYDY